VIAREKIKVAVLYGGTSAEREVSLNSGAAVNDAVLRAGYQAELIDTKDGLIDKLATAKPDVAFNVVHGTGGEDGQLQALLEYLAIPYSGSGVAASAIGMDKLKCKMLWSAAGLPTATHITLDATSRWQDVAAKLGAKFVVKPTAEGSSVGVSLVRSEEEFIKAIAICDECKGEAIAERFMSGREFSVPVIDGVAYPAIHLKPANEFYDYNAKYVDGTTEYLIPSGLSDAQEAQMRAWAEQASAIIGARHWSRVDFMEDANGQLNLLEINTVPGMTATSLVPMSLASVGVDFVSLIDRIVQLAYAGVSAK